jgi:adenine C2-methylase RlmN of 23S rRNA A2503 and tRNA A37
MQRNREIDLHFLIGEINEMLAFLKIINHDKGLNIGARHITVSTSGIIPKIRLPVFSM